MGAYLTLMQALFTLVLYPEPVCRTHLADTNQQQSPNYRLSRPASFRLNDGSAQHNLPVRPQIPGKDHKTKPSAEYAY